MRTNYLYNLDDDTLEEQLDSVRETLDFLVSRGATTDRWHALIFCAKVPSVLFEVVRLLNTKLVPALQFLSLWWKTRMDSDAEAQEHEYLRLPELSARKRIVFSFQMPRLRNLHLNAIPIFDEVKHLLPSVTGLAHLKLIALEPYPLPKLHALLLSSPQLQSLTLSSGLADDFDFEPTMQRIHLPFLRSFSLDFKECSRWAWGVIDMINAPTVEYLHLALSLDSEMVVKLVNRVTTGISKDKFALVSQALASGQPIPRKSIYPLLQHLVIESNSSLPDTLRVILSVFPTITHVSLPEKALPLLGSAPWGFPNLEFISAKMRFALCGILHRRAKAGFPVKRAEVVGGTMWLPNWPESVQVVERRVPSPATDSDDDDEYNDDFYNDPRNLYSDCDGYDGYGGYGDLW